MDLKQLGKKLLYPPIWVMAVLIVICTAGLVGVFAGGFEQSILGYIVYVLSFYTLSVFTLYCILVLPGNFRQIRQRIYDHPLGNRFMTDRAFRTHVTLYLSLTVNLLYVALNLVSWHLFQSWWFMVLAVYYAIMSIMRFLLVRFFRTQKIGTGLMREWKRSRLCACILLLVNLSLSGAVLMILYNSNGYDYPGILIYVMAMYTFYATTHAIVSIIKYRKQGSPVISTAKVVSLSAALVSMLNLETAMFAQFGQEMPLKSQQLMIMLTGAGVSIIVISLSVILIITATKAIRREENGK